MQGHRRPEPGPPFSPYRVCCSPTLTWPPLFPLQGVLQSDPDLAPHVGHLKYRWQRYVETKKAIEAAEGSLANFALVGAWGGRGRH